MIHVVLHDNNTAVLKESPGNFEKCPLFIMHPPRLIFTHHPLPGRFSKFSLQFLLTTSMSGTVLNI